MQLKLNKDLGYYELVDNDSCGLCGEDIAGTPGTVRVAAVVEGAMQISDCAVYTDAEGTVRVANTEEFVRCFT